MRTTGRTLAASALLGAGLLFAGPAAAQTACPYPFDTCPTQPPSEAPTTPIGGGGGSPSTGETPEETVGGGGGGGATDGGDGGGAGAGTPLQGSSGGAAGLPFTGGEITLIALAGAAALGGGAVLVAAGRKRAQA